MNVSEEIPPSLRKLYDAAGPVLRFRIVRDLIGRDESYISTVQLGHEIPKLPEVQQLLAAQELDGSWGGVLCGQGGASSGYTTESAFLRLCELGMERSTAIEKCIDNALMPTLFDRQILWEFPDEGEAARRLVRDKALQLICRATREHDDALKPLLEILLTEWDHLLRHATHGHELFPPTAAGFAAVCWYPWNDDDFERVQKIVTRMVAHAEDTIGQPPKCPDFFAPHVHHLSEKWEYLARPQDLFHTLELSARCGIARALPVSQWLLEEVEARQDADGWFRFETTVDLAPSWYFPLEDHDTHDYSMEWTFRGALIFKLLEYDL
jgi:hypothetical protein